MSELKSKIENIINKLQGRHIFQYLVFVVISTVFWLLLTLNNEIQQEHKLSFKINSIPENITFISDTPKNIKVIVKEKGSSSLKLLLSSLPEILVNFDEYSDHKNVFRINNVDLKNLVAKSIGSNSTIISIYPDSIKAIYTDHQPKRVPIKFNINATTNFKYTISGDIKCSQDSVLIYANSQDLNRIQSVETTELSLKDIEDTVHDVISIKPLPNVKIVPNIINFTVPVEPLIIKKSLVNIRAVGVPNGYNIITFPSKIQASYLIPLSKYKNEQKIFAEVYYNEINKISNKMKLYSFPDKWEYGTINFESDSVDYIIENYN